MVASNIASHGFYLEFDAENVNVANSFSLDPNQKGKQETKKEDNEEEGEN